MHFVLLSDADPRPKCVNDTRCSINARCQIVDYANFKLGCACKERFVGNGISCTGKLKIVFINPMLKRKQFKALKIIQIDWPAACCPASQNKWIDPLHVIEWDDNEKRSQWQLFYSWTQEVSKACTMHIKLVMYVTTAIKHNRTIILF